MLTHRQAELHRFIFEYTRHHGESPKQRLMRDWLGMKSVSGINRLIDELEIRGYLRRIHPRRFQSIELLKKPPLNHTKYFKVDEETMKLVPFKENAA